MDKDLEEVFNRLKNPDETKEMRFNLTEEFERMLLGMVLTDYVFLTQSLSLIKPVYFTNEHHRLICSAVFDYYDKYKGIPNEIIIKQTIADKVKDDIAKALCEAELKAILNYYVKGLENREVLMDRIVKFAKTHALRLAFNESFNLLKKNFDSEENWDKIYDIYRDAVTIERNFHPGQDYFNEYEERYRRAQEEVDDDVKLSLGFEILNNSLQLKGPRRGEIYAVMGLPGTGKSLWLVNASIANIALGHKVLYISCEMDEDNIAFRFDSMMADVPIWTVQESQSMVRDALEEHIKDYEDRRQLVIKQFPGGSADVNTIRSHYQQLKMTGFKPDVVIVDYIGEMKDAPGLATHESRFRIVRDLRGFGIEESHLTLTAMQPNRGARGVVKENDINQFIDDDNIADAFAQTQPLDFFWSINQTAQEKKANVGRGFVIKSRYGESRFPFHMRYRPSLRMEEISKDSHLTELSLVVEDDHEAVERVVGQTFDNIDSVGNDTGEE
jgi:replicative DNA helicase